MAISNDWQIIDGLEYLTFSDINNTHNGNKMLTAESAEKVATAIGWEVVEMSDYVSTVTAGTMTYHASDIRVIRPVKDADENAYNVGIMLMGLLYDGDYYNNYMSQFAIQLDTGTILGIIANFEVPRQANFHLLRPTASGAFAVFFTNSSRSIYFDKFLNPKENWNKWGIYETYGEFFTDVWTGLKFTAKDLQYRQRQFTFGGFVALKKLTAINSAGVYSAKTLYRRIIDYSQLEKTVELDGATYVNVGGSDMYIRLAD